MFVIKMKNSSAEIISSYEKYFVFLITQWHFCCLVNTQILFELSPQEKGTAFKILKVIWFPVFYFLFYPFSFNFNFAKTSKDVTMCFNIFVFHMYYYVYKLNQIKWYFMFVNHIWAYPEHPFYIFFVRKDSLLFSKIFLNCKIEAQEWKDLNSPETKNNNNPQRN